MSQNHFIRCQILRGPSVVPMLECSFRPRRLASSKSTGSFTVNMPSETTTSWERGAKTVKNTDTTNQYLEHIRDVHDPSLHIKTLEDELKGTMGKALGKQGDKIFGFLGKMESDRKKYDKILNCLELKQEEAKLKPEEHESDDGSSAEIEILKRELYSNVQSHNKNREEAVNARWELIVHRQAIGFITNNHRFVNEKFPIPDNLQLPDHLGSLDDDDDGCNGFSNQPQTRTVTKEAVTRNFGDQLDWWENIGRWR